MKILIGYLPTKQGEAALRRGVDEARIRGAELVIVHTLEDLDRLEISEVDAEHDQREMLARLLANEGLGGEVVWIPGGKRPAEEILREANERRVDLIVIGVRHRSAVGKLLLGSNAQEVILNAPCPVLSVRAD